MDNLTKTQFVTLIILVSFVTSLVTGIVTVTLVNQAPPLMTQAIYKVIEEVTPGLNNSNANQAPPVFTNEQDFIVKAVEKVSSAVVSVIATKDLPVFEQYFVNPFGQDEFFKQFFPPELLPNFQVPQYRQKGTENKQISTGTGFFISVDGLIATNKHVVADKEAVYWIIMNDGKKLKAKVLALDSLQDVAILKIDEDVPPASGYNFVPLGDSENIKVGQTVIAIGNALGEFQNTVSVGVISGLRRSIIASSATGGDEVLQELIQTDAAINPGNSGGPLLDLSGKAIGINTAIAQGAENVGFALPINLVKKDLADIKQFGKIEYAYLGIRYALINAQVKEEKKLSVDYGALLSKGPKDEPAVMANSPAGKMGLKEGDIVLEFNGVKITQSNTLSSLINRHRAGEKITLKVLREGKESNFSGTLEPRPENI